MTKSHARAEDSDCLLHETDAKSLSTKGRRSSTRIRNLKEKGRNICYNEKSLKKFKSEQEGKRTSGRMKRRTRGSCNRQEQQGLEMVEEMLTSGDSGLELEGLEGRADLLNIGLNVDSVNGSGIDSAGSDDSKSASLKVKKTLRTFNLYLLHFVQEEEIRCGSTGDARNKEKRQGMKITHKRPDLKAVTRMQEKNSILYPFKQIGQVPGVEVGHRFFSRAEMVAVGFHSHWLNGIDYMGMSYRKEEGYSRYKFPIAVAIVLSGQYEDDVDNSEDIVYTGQGGNNLLGNKHQIGDQVMKRGNLALKHSMEQGLPVRVVRGHLSKDSYVGKVYTYDGLYEVVKYWSEKGVSGFTVFKYRMKRLKDQPDLTTDQVNYVRGRVPPSISEVDKWTVCTDISGGQESIPIPATSLDTVPFPKMSYKYTKSLKLAENVKIPTPAPGCNCIGVCSDPEVCACAKLNGGEFPYVRRSGGRLIKAKNVVYECGPNCCCETKCVNRTSQRGIRHRLEVFHTTNKGWGVRSWDSIPSGSPVCEYVGIVKRSDEAESVDESNYVFDIDCVQTMKGLDGRERRSRDVSIPSGGDEKSTDSVPEFCIDAGSIGNVARFINHGCEPNLFVQCVLTSHHDLELARVMLFAADNIPPLQELSYDYGYTIDGVRDSEGNIKQMPCNCGAEGCRKRLF